MSLYSISNELRDVYKLLESGDGVDLETGEIKQEVINALQLNQANLQEKAIDYGYVLKSFENEIELYDKEIARLKKHRDILNKTYKKLKDNLTNAMLEFGIVELKGKTIKLNFKKSESVEVYDLNLLEDRFKVVKFEADKTAIKEAIRNGEDVIGARVVTNHNLQIK